MNTGAANLDSLLLQHTNKKEREILDAYAGRGQGEDGVGKGRKEAWCRGTS